MPRAGSGLEILRVKKKHIFFVSIEYRMPVARVGDCVDVGYNIIKVKKVEKRANGEYAYVFCAKRDTNMKTCQSIGGQTTDIQHESCPCQNGGRRTKRSTRRSKRSRRARTRRQ